MSKLFLGIDVSKDKFDVALLLENSKILNKTCKNNATGFSDLIAWIKKKVVDIDLSELHACMEATGKYGEALANYLFEHKYYVSVVNPARIKGFAQSQMSRNKTDKTDSELIAKFCKAMHPKLWQPEPVHIKGLQELVRRLEVLQKFAVQENNRLEGNVSVYIRKSIETMLKEVTKEIEAIKQAIRDHIDNHPDLKEKEKLLDTIPGIGEATIAQILAFIGNVERFENVKQVAAFVGLNPKQRQSGSSIRGVSRLSKVGDSRLRKAFYLPAIVAKKYNPVIKSFCERLAATGKPTMLIIGAAMRKLLHIIYGVLKSGKAFDPNLALS